MCGTCLVRPCCAAVHPVRSQPSRSRLHGGHPEVWCGCGQGQLRWSVPHLGWMSLHCPGQSAYIIDIHEDGAVSIVAMLGAGWLVQLAGSTLFKPGNPLANFDGRKGHNGPGCNTTDDRRAGLSPHQQLLPLHCMPTFFSQHMFTAYCLYLLHRLAHGAAATHVKPESRNQSC